VRTDVHSALTRIALTAKATRTTTATEKQAARGIQGKHGQHCSSKKPRRRSAPASPGCSERPRPARSSTP
jgi:hypothetical protein